MNEEQAPGLISKEDWDAMPEFKFPWIGTETGTTISQLHSSCGECHGMITGLKGEIYESFGTVEIKMQGLCPTCEHVVPLRSRLYPARQQFSILYDGQWVNLKMVTKWQAWRKDFLKLALPFMLGMPVSIAMCCSLTEPNQWTWIVWGITYFGIILIAAAVAYSKNMRSGSTKPGEPQEGEK